MATIQLSSRREGFALPMAILLVGFLTAGLVGAFSRQSAELGVVTSGSAQTDAFAVAEAGLENYIATGTTTQTTVMYTYSKGTATVVATQIKVAALATNTAIWLIRSTGVAKGGTRKNPAARRTVAQLAYKAAPTMQVLSSWTSLSGIDKNGASGDVSGTDACGVQGELAGASVPTGMFTGKTEPFSGDPDISYMGTQTEMANQIKIDWVGITSITEPAITADIIYCMPSTYGYNVGRAPCSAFPASSAFTANYWPTIIINGSSPLPSNGHGMLIVTGNLTLDGGDEWEGVIMVGGIITDNGNGGIGGAVITGLNVMLGETVGQSSKANGTKDYDFDSCAVANATNNMARLSPVTNAWMDNWNAW